METDLALKDVDDVIRSAVWEVKKAREGRLVEREVLGAGVRGSKMSLLGDILRDSRDLASSDTSLVLVQHRHVVDT